MNIVVEKQHLRRAIAAANRVSDAGTEQRAPDSGVIFMTAVLLVERLAATFRCDPHAVLTKMAACFDLKRRYLAERKDHN